MARTEARIRCAVWRNREFTALGLEAQGLYWMLLSQPDVSLAGVVPYNPRKLEHLCGSPIDRPFQQLLDARFVVLDDTTGEVWVRTFARHDGVLASPKTRAGMWSAWSNILSATIRAAFLEQLEEQHLAEAVEQGWVTEHDFTDARSEAQQQAPDTPSRTPQDGVSDGVSLARADSDTDSYTDTNTLAPAEPTRKKRKPDPIFDAIVEACGLDPGELTKSARGAVNSAVKQLRDIGATPDGIRARADLHRQRWPDATCTPSSLAKNYAQLGAKAPAGPRRAGPAPPAPRDADYLEGFFPPDDPRSQERTA